VTVAGAGPVYSLSASENWNDLAEAVSAASSARWAWARRLAELITSASVSLDDAALSASTATASSWRDP
jgi:hypothetical protein